MGVTESFCVAAGKLRAVAGQDSSVQCQRVSVRREIRGPLSTLVRTRPASQRRILPMSWPIRTKVASIVRPSPTPATSGSQYSGARKTLLNVHQTDSPNVLFEFMFTGTGIDQLAEKDKSLRIADVYPDGNFQRNVGPRLENFPRFSQVVVFSRQRLKPGRHIIRIANRNYAGIVVDAFRVYKTPKEI